MNKDARHVLHTFIANRTITRRIRSLFIATSIRRRSPLACVIRHFQCITRPPLPANSLRVPLLPRIEMAAVLFQ